MVIMMTSTVAMNIQAVSPLFGTGAAGVAGAAAGVAIGAATGAAAGVATAAAGVTAAAAGAAAGVSAGLAASWADALRAPHRETARAALASHLKIVLFIRVPLKVRRCRSRPYGCG